MALFRRLVVLGVTILLLSVPGHTLQLTEVVTGLSAPVFVTHAGDGSGRLFIVEQAGRIRVFNGTELLDTPFLDISGSVSTGGEQGLLGLAFHPQFTTNRRFFIFYTDSTGDIRIARYEVPTVESNVADQTTGTVILTIRHRKFSNHNGGMIAFGADGFLYISTGDGGSGGDPDENAQNLGRLLGKILRIDVDRGRRYSIPKTNPFRRRKGARPEIFAYGFRNTWRFSIDRGTGRIFGGDVGQDSLEEVNIIRRGGNYGWDVREGTACFEPKTGCTQRGFKRPVHVYPRSDGFSITGGYVYRGSAIPELQGKYLFGDFVSTTVWALAESSPGVYERETLVTTGRNISSFGEDEAGELYLVDFAGIVLRFSPS